MKGTSTLSPYSDNEKEEKYSGTSGVPLADNTKREFGNDEDVLSALPCHFHEDPFNGLHS